MKKGKYWLAYAGDGIVEPEYYLIGLDNDELVDIPETTSSRVDAIVVYLDLSGTVGATGGGVVHVVRIAGTDGSMDHPTESDITSVVGTNPYALICYVKAPTSGNYVNDEDIVDLRTYYTLALSPRKNYLMNTALDQLRFGRYCSDWSGIVGNRTTKKVYIPGGSGYLEYGHVIYFDDEPELSVGDYLTGSINIEKISSTGSVKIALQAYDGSSWNTIIARTVYLDGEDSSGEIRTVYISGSIPSSYTVEQIRFIVETNSDIKIQYPKLEKGNNPTPYIERPTEFRSIVVREKFNTASVSTETTAYYNIIDDLLDANRRCFAIQLNAYAGNANTTSAYVKTYHKANGSYSDRTSLYVYATGTTTGTYNFSSTLIPVENDYEFKVVYKADGGGRVILRYTGYLTYV